MALTPEKIAAFDKITGLSTMSAPQSGSQSRIDELKAIAQQSQSTQDSTPSFYQSKTVEPIKNFSEGVAKGELSTLKGLGTLGQKVLDSTLNKIPGVNAGSDIYRPDTTVGQTATQTLTPDGTAQNIGFGAERLAELLAPASKIAKAEKTADILFRGSGFLPAAERVVAKSAINAIPTGLTVAAQKGDIKAGAEAGLISGLTRGAFATIGEGTRALKMPERLYSTIFKNTKNDMLAELKNDGIRTLQENNPQRYQELVSKGIIKVGADGTPKVNETLAEQALDRGLRGSIRHMADTVVEGTLNSEDKVQTIAKNYAGKVNLTEPQFPNVLKKIATEYEDVGFGEIADEATNLANELSTSKGQVSAETAIKVKRFLDRVRIASSFDKPVVNLSTSQANLKTLSDAVRGRVNSIPGMGEVMKDYSFNIQALEALAKEASRRGNNQVLSLIDSLFLSGAYAGNNPVPGVTMGTLRKLLLSAPGTTYLAQALKSSAISPVAIGGLSVGSASGQSLLSGQ